MVFCDYLGLNMLNFALFDEKNFNIFCRFKENTSIFKDCRNKPMKQNKIEMERSVFNVCFDSDMIR